MMTISDIFDALTATDRPYKRAVPVMRALEILDMEARAGQLDRDLLEAFILARVYESVARDGGSGGGDGSNGSSGSSGSNGSHGD
jgi:response regulator RpfG family c-di-GMP phosphodiesterase